MFSKTACSPDRGIIKYNYKMVQKLPGDGLPDTPQRKERK